MFENEIFISMFTKVFGGIAVVIVITMPYLFNRMKYAGAKMGFMAVYSGIAFCFLAAIFAGHLAVVNTELETVSWVTVALGLNTLVSIWLVYYHCFRDIIK